MSQNQNINVLVAAMHDVRPFVTLLSAVNFNAAAAIAISSAGLTIVVEDAKMLVAKAYAPHDMFDEYEYNPKNEEELSAEESDDEEPSSLFHIHLDTVLECLNIFGTGSATLLYENSDKRRRRKKKWGGLSEDSDEDQQSSVAVGKGKKVAPPKGNTTLEHYFFSGEGKKTGMRMTYAGRGHPLVLILGEDAGGPITTCEIETIEEDGVTELAFDDSLKLIKIILRSSWLSDSLLELDPSCEKLTFLGIPATEKSGNSNSNGAKSTSKATLRITGEGTFGSTQMDYPYDRDVLESFECAQSVKFSYRVSHIASALKAMQTSLKTSLRIDSDGLLSLQFMMTAAGSGIFIEFRCLPMIEE